MATTENDRDWFDELVTACIRSYGAVFSDKLALDANGVIGKQRVLVMENERYQRETKKLLAKHTIDDLAEIDDLMSAIAHPGDTEEDGEPAEDDGGEFGPGAAPEEIEPEEPLPPIPEFTEPYDVRHPEEWKARKAAFDKAAKKKHDAEVARRNREALRRQKEAAKAGEPRVTVKKTKRFDKTLVETRLKLIQERRRILDAQTEGEENEGNALNIFFIPVTKEEFEAIETVEVSQDTGSADLDDGESMTPEREAMGEGISKELTKRKVNTGVGYHYEIIDGEQTMVED